MTFNPYSSYQTSPDLERSGVWLEEPTFRVRVARAGGRNMKFEKVSEAVMRPVRRLAQAGKLSTEQALEKMCEIFAKAVVLEWQMRYDQLPKEMQEEYQNNTVVDGFGTVWVPGIYDPDMGNIVPTKQDVVQSTLRVMPEFVEYMVSQTKDGGLFRETIEDDVKN